MIFLCISVLVWSFLEASFWWVAPDISISIAYVYFPKFWKRFIILALLGALLGSIVTYCWAYFAPDSWLAYVGGMRFHTARNIEYVQSVVHSDSVSIIKGAWGGIPYKLFFGIGPMHGIAFAQLALLGLLSRLIRFSVVLGVTCGIRHFAKPWSTKHPAQLSLILLLIWATMITLFDVVVNRLYL